MNPSLEKHFDQCDFISKTKLGLTIHKKAKHKQEKETCADNLIQFVQLNGHVSSEDLDEYTYTHMELKAVFIGEDEISAES